MGHLPALAFPLNWAMNGQPSSGPSFKCYFLGGRGRQLEEPLYLTDFETGQLSSKSFIPQSHSRCFVASPLRKFRLTVSGPHSGQDCGRGSFQQSAPGVSDMFV